MSGSKSKPTRPDQVVTIIAVNADGIENAAKSPTRERESRELHPAPRELLAKRLPSFTQPLITFLSGIAAPGQNVIRRSQEGRVIEVFSLLFLGLAGGIWAVHSGHTSWLLLAWLVTVSAARDLHLSILHHASHSNVISRRWSHILGYVSAALLIETAFPIYRERHQLHHRKWLTSTHDDDTVRFLLQLGLKPGAPVAENLAIVKQSLVSRGLIFRQLRSRVRSQLRGDRLTRTGFVLHVLTLIALASQFGWVELLLAWVVPLCVLYPIAKTAALAVEHTWVGDSCSATDLNVRCVVLLPHTWTIRNTVTWLFDSLLNVIVRFCVLPGDMVNHGLHHAEVRSDWANHIRAASTKPAAPDVWGYRQALRVVLESVAASSHEHLKARATKRTSQPQ